MLLWSHFSSAWIVHRVNPADFSLAYVLFSWLSTLLQQIWCDLHSHYSFLYSQCGPQTILDRIKWNNYPPLPISPHKQWWRCKGEKTSHFGVIELGGGGWVVVQMFHLFCRRLQQHSNFLGVSDQGGKVHDVNPMWSTNPWNKARPQRQEFHPLLFPISVWVL